MAHPDQHMQRPPSSRLSDSVELRGLPIPGKGSPVGWLDAVRGTQVHLSASAAGAPRSASAPAKGTPQRRNFAEKGHWQRSTESEQTPDVLRHPLEMTAMGSPILVDTDDSDAHIDKLLARVKNLPGPDDYAASPYPSSSPTPRLALPPVRAQWSESPASTALQMQSDSVSPSRRFIPIAKRTEPTMNALSTTNTVAKHYSVENGRFAAAASQNVKPHRGYFDDMSASIGGREQRYDQDSPTKYSSVLMQALSRQEGLSAMKGRWTPMTQRGASSTYSADADEAKSSSSDIPPDMYVEAMRAKVAKQQWIALEKARQEVLEEARRRRDCPFAPEVSPYAARMQRPTSLRPENRFKAEIIRRKHWVAKKQQEEVERELQSCTFRPLTLRTAHLDPAVMKPPPPVTTVFHELYTEAENRRTFERDVKPQLLHQLEEHQRVSHGPMAPVQLAAVVERLCARGVIRNGTSDGSAPKKGKVDGIPYGGDVQSARRPVSDTEGHRPMLSNETKRIVAAQIAAGERDENIVRQLYHNIDEGFAQTQLKREMDEEQERLAHAERAMLLAQERKKLQKEHYRAVLVAKFRTLAQHLANVQSRKYRVTAPQSVVELARASLDLLSAGEAEELLSAMEHCGKQRLTEKEFVVVVFRYMSEQRVNPAESALLRNAPPPPLSIRRAASAVSLKRAGSTLGISEKAVGSPGGFPHIKREKPDPEVIEQVRARRAAELKKWKEEHERRRAISDGVLIDGSEFTFQPAPRRLIPYECRPDVTVPVRSTKSEELRRAYVSARVQGTSSPLAPTAVAPALCTQAPPATRMNVGELLSRGTPDSQGQARDRSVAAGTISTQEVRGAAAPASPNSGPLTTSPATRPPQRAEASRVLSTSPASGAALAEQGDRAGSYAAALGRSPTPTHRQAASISPVAAPPKKSNPGQLASQPHSACSCRNRVTVTSAAPLIDQITRSTPEERERLGRELLLRQLREHQRRSGD